MISQRNASSARQILDYMAQVFSNVAHISFVLSFRYFLALSSLPLFVQTKKWNGMKILSENVNDCFSVNLTFKLSTTGIRLIVIWYLLMIDAAYFQLDEDWNLESCKLEITIFKSPFLSKNQQNISSETNTNWWPKYLEFARHLCRSKCSTVHSNFATIVWIRTFFKWFRLRRRCMNQFVVFFPYSIARASAD